MLNNNEQEAKVDPDYFKKVGSTITSFIWASFILCVAFFLFFIGAAKQHSIFWAIWNAVSCISYGFYIKSNLQLLKKHNAIVKTLKL